MAIIKKSTQAATICKPSLLPVTFLLHVPFWDVRGMHKYTQHTSANSCNLLFYETASPSPPDPPHPFPPLYLQNGGNFGILHCWDGRRGNNPSRWTSSWKNTMVSLMPVLGWIGSDVSDLGHPKMLPPPSAQGLADGAVFSFTWKVAKCPWPGSRNDTRICLLSREFIYFSFVIPVLLDSTSHKGHANNILQAGFQPTS